MLVKKPRPRKKTQELTIIKASNNLIDASYKRFTLSSKQILWHIAKRMQEQGYTPNSFQTHNVLTPYETVTIVLETGEIKKSSASKCVKIELDIKTLMRDSGMSYTTIRDTVEKLKKANLQIYSPDKKMRTSTSLFPTAEFIDGEQRITIFMWSDILLHLLQLQVWAQLDYKHIMRFKSEYTLRTYELLCKVQNQEYAAFYKSLDDLNKEYDTKYKTITEINRKILDIAKSELDEKSKFSFEYNVKYENKGKGRPTAVGVTLYLTKNNPQPSLFS
jgi:hypothetical protein